ncbi:universal stress protein [Nocardioides plantarum]|uniref:Universal stress protein n=1 Tax=Nocardioides plantarum TaxID=29299 RepID=A0ABV5K9E8_9ACTN|nr:universal stress protein [Nocardioides plantarum]
MDEHVADHPDTIVCAVGYDGSPAAVDVAADEAVRRGLRLHLVHVAPKADGALTDTVLDGAVAQARARHHDLVLTRDPINRTWVAAGLADAGRDAAYVVIERTHRHRLSRLLSGSTADGIAFKVAAPVLSVPHGWAPDPSSPAVVTVAVQDVAELPDLVGLAAAEARARGADLVVLHAASASFGHDEAQVDAHRDWIDRAHLLLDTPIRAATEPYPDLEVRLDVVLDRPADVVVRASTGSTLLVVGRRHHEHAWGTHLGPVVRRVLLDAVCPVLLPPDKRTGTTAPQPFVGHERDHQPIADDVVVAVGEDQADGSLRYAIGEADARGVGLHLVHVVEMPAVDGVPLAEVWHDAEAHGRMLLKRAADTARTVGGPHLRVTHHLVEGGPVVRGLVAEGRHASAIVVQHRRLGRARRLVTRSVTSALAARTDVPVIAVPAEWTSKDGRPGYVVVGLQDPDEASTVLTVALEEATRRAMPVRVAHAASLSPTEQRRFLGRVEEVHRRYPAVTVHHVVKDLDPVDLLVAATRSAELVVIGRRHSTLSRRSHLGPVARGLLERSTVPVMLAPPPVSAPD